MYGSLDKWNSLLSELEKYDSEEDFISTGNKITESMIESIKSSMGYQTFNSEDMNKFSKKSEYSSSDIYKDCNCGKKYISIDMSKANFSSLYAYDKNIFRGTSSWEDFVGLFTDSKYIADSKYIRQIVFGNCNPKRVSTYEKYLMLNLVDEIKDVEVVSDADIVSVTNDEVVIDITSYEDVETIFEILTVIVDAQDIPFHISMFTLKKLYNVGFLRKFSDGSTDIKCISANFVPMVIRKLSGQAIRKEDMYFISDGVLCEYLESPISLS